MPKCQALLPLVPILLGLPGCAALPDTTLGHRCGIPEGVACHSTQAVYERTVAGTLPGLERQPEPLHPSGVQESPIFTHDAPRAWRTNALYAPPEELRIWVNRWRDVDGDLHEDAFIYVVLGEGQWRVRD